MTSVLRARLVGKGGVAAIVEATSLTRSPLQRAVGNVDAGLEVSARIRAPSPCRPKAIVAQPLLLPGPDRLSELRWQCRLAPQLRWTPRSTRAPAEKQHRLAQRASWLLARSANRLASC